MWDSAVRSHGDMAGIFEFDGDTSYFYLYSTTEPDDAKIKGAIHIATGIPNFAQADIGIRWTEDEDFVGLFFRSQLWAAFDCNTGAKYGGNYKAGDRPMMPPEILDLFA